MPSSSKAELWLSFGDSSVLALSIPVSEAPRFSVYPLKWLRYMGFAIVGREGHLSTSNTGPEINDYTEDIAARSYYFVSQGEPRLVDAGVIDNRTSDASSLSSRREDFNQSLIERDGGCVITGDAPGGCRGYHIIPHSKGDNYMRNLSSYRGPTYDLDEELNDVDDPRNGLLLIMQLHHTFTLGASAFLKTPNFAMTVDDVPYNTQCGSRPTSRLTLQYLGLDKIGHWTSAHIPHNSDGREPQDVSTWPPAIIVDLFYAAVAVNTWGSENFAQDVRERVKDHYYVNNTQAPVQKGKARSGARQEGGKKARDPKKKRFGDVMDAILTLQTRFGTRERQNYHQAQDSDASSSSASSRPKVEAWLESMKEKT